MFNNEDRIIELENRLIDLPKGYISKKTINGKVKNYYQWTEDNKKKSKYVNNDNIEQLTKDIEERRNIQNELQLLYKEKYLSNSFEYIVEETEREFRTDVYYSSFLTTFIASTINFENRNCLKEIMNFINDENDFSKVLVLYGLRRTGKTTLLKQAILRLTNSQLNKAVFIDIKPNNSINDLYHDMKHLLAKGFKYVFIDEVTLIEDFISGSAFLADQFAACGMKVILTGTDSLGFVFAEDEQLYDRAYFIHTTFIPYQEFAKCFKFDSIDEYIRYGGTMSVSGTNYNKSRILDNPLDVNRYVDSAIAHNIQNSLKYYQYGDHFRSLYKLYEKNELTSAINRVVEDINHRFTIEVLTKDFKSSDLAISAKNLQNDKESHTDILYQIDKEQLTKALKNSLEILNKNEQTVQIDDTNRIEIREYLLRLNLLYSVEVFNISSFKRDKLDLIAQPGLRYAQAKELIRLLLLDKQFSQLAKEERVKIQERILSEVKGRMMEEIVILETKLAYPEKEVSKVKFDVGEFDMVVYDPKSASVDIYEIKHSDKIDQAQTRHLRDTEKLELMRQEYSNINSLNVIYRGPNKTIDGINYLNVEKYLSKLPNCYSID